MAHYAQVDEDWIVQRVIVVGNDVLLDDNGIECDWLGEQFCRNLFGADTKWIRTSYNGKIHKNYAGQGYTFDPDRHAFIAPRPYPSWVLNEVTCRWDAPLPYPMDGGVYAWDEDSRSWVKPVHLP